MNLAAYSGKNDIALSSIESAPCSMAMPVTAESTLLVTDWIRWGSSAS